MMIVLYAFETPMSIAKPTSTEGRHSGNSFAGISLFLLLDDKQDLDSARTSFSPSICSTLPMS